jgi:hypothetical protein
MLRRLAVAAIGTLIFWAVLHFATPLHEAIVYVLALLGGFVTMLIAQHYHLVNSSEELDGPNVLHIPPQ